MSNPFDQFDAMPAGIRNNNPLNITGSGWDGQTGADGQFAQFATPEAGRAAADTNLQAYATKHGLRTVAGIVGRWAPPSENDTQGYVAQVSKKLGVDPGAPLDMSDPTVRGRLLDAMQERETGQPTANPFDQFDAPAQAPQSQGQGGPQSTASPQPAPVVVVNPENGKPYSDAQQRTYAGLIQSGKLDPNAAPGSEAFPRGLWDPNDTPKPGEWYVDQQGVKRQAPGAMQDAAQGFLSGAVRGGAGIADMVSQATPLGQIPQMLRTAVQLGSGELPQSRPFSGASDAVAPALPRPVTKLGQYAETAGEMLPNAVTPGGIVRKAASVALPAIGSQLAGDIASAQGADPNLVNLARFGGGIAGGLGAGLGLKGPAVAEAPMTVDQLRQAKSDAYAKVDASGYRLPSKAVQNLADEIAAEVARKGGPKAALLYPASQAVSARLSALAKQRGGVPLTSLDELRSDIYEALVAPGDRESPIGSMMRHKIDGLIDSHDAPDIVAARDLNTRYMKAKAVTDRLDSADLRAGSTYSGGNYVNAVRQKLRPLVDPTSAQQARNLTPQEQAALRQVVTGTPVQNALRYGSNFLRNKIVQVPFGVMSHGMATPFMEAAGMGLNKAAEGQTQSAVQRLLDIIAHGGTKPPARVPQLTYNPGPLAPINVGALIAMMQQSGAAEPAPRQ